jgi:RNase P protein component
MEDLPSGVDLVISARPAAAEASFDELSEEFISSVDRLSKSGEARSGGGS